MTPVVIFEVLSRTTADIDHGHKWMLYQQIPSLYALRIGFTR